MQEHVCIILFTRYPQVGSVKTRLIPKLGAEGATKIHKKMAQHAFLQAVQTGFDVHIHYTGATEEQMRHWLDPNEYYSSFMYIEQHSHGDLGQRMSYAFAKSFALGYKKVLLMGSDCPDNTTENLHKALAALEIQPCVFGPSHDGGYYLIALSQHHEALFTNIAWGTDTVLQQSIAKVNEYSLLEYLQDVDLPEHIPKRISIIIPTLNEEHSITQTIMATQHAFNVEVIVVDAHSKDATCHKAQKLGAKVYSLPKENTPSRAAQMNLGASKATGDLLLFLHADSILPPLWSQHLRQAFKNPSTSLTYFSFALSGKFTGKKLIEWGTNMRAKLCSLPYGDQGLCMRKQDFFNLQGYASTPILEDVLLVKNARTLGHIVELPAPLITSGRRWEKHGAFTVTCYNQMVYIALKLGATPQLVHDAYRKGTNPLLCILKK